MSAADPVQRPYTRVASFRTTRWSVVLAAQGKAAGDASESLEALCRQYWAPLYAYARHRGHARHDAEDLTQGFFARLLEKGWLTAATPEQGRFRSFLLVAMKRFLANEWDRSRAQKRGGGAPVIHLDTELAETRLLGHTGAASSADAHYDRQWALALLDAVMARLRREHEAAGKLAEYDLLKPCLTAVRGDIDYDELAATLGIEPASARSAVHRLRKQFRACFREEVAETVADASEIEDEMRAVAAAMVRD